MCNGQSDAAAMLECIRMLGRVLSIRLVARSSKSYPLSLTFLRSVSRVQDEENVEDDGDDGDDDGDGDDDDLLEERRSRGGNAALKIDKRLRVESTSQGLFGVSARRRSWRGRLVTSKRQRQRIPERNFAPMCLSIYSHGGAGSRRRKVPRTDVDDRINARRCRLHLLPGRSRAFLNRGKTRGNSRK